MKNKIMSERIKRRSSIRIYVIQYSIFLMGAITFVAGIYLYDSGIAQTEQGLNGRTMEIVGIFSIVCGLVCVILSYVYARIGSRIIGTNCPFCYGSGYVDKGSGKDSRREVCPVCNGTGKMYDKARKHQLEREEQKEEETSQNLETNTSEEIQQENT